jgi:hypothetical protein
LASALLPNGVDSAGYDYFADITGNPSNGNEEIQMGRHATGQICQNVWPKDDGANAPNSQPDASGFSSVATGWPPRNLAIQPAQRPTTRPRANGTSLESRRKGHNASASRSRGRLNEALKKLSTIVNSKGLEVKKEKGRNGNCKAADVEFAVERVQNLEKELETKNRIISELKRDLAANMDFGAQKSRHCG